MSGPNAARSLPPGDRDDARHSVGLAPQPGERDPGRKPELPTLETIDRVMSEQAKAFAAVRAAAGRGDGAGLDNAAWRLAEACAPSLLMLAARLRNEIAAARRSL